ncbi:MAG: DHH family phosphoesterase [Bacteroidia bacterium]|nr:DHH family phosphoesterase [Bacteroidia bacterium]MCX7651966.1 DHH family phosphoesterase [Bacteroidia bacterium]MDW8416117.1 DHH family phosphoesterase [Bacteroidia bacterium]
MNSAPEWVAALEAAERIFCLSHPKPDGDAVGSLLGLYHAFTARGKAVTLVLPDPVPGYLRFLPGWEKILVWGESPEVIPTQAAQADLFFCVDFGRWDRIPPALKELIDSQRLIWVDHHADSEKLSASWNFWKVEAAATAELLYTEVLKPWYGSRLPLPARVALYTGMVTDTGGFRFRSVTPHTLRTAAELIEPPFPLEAIHYYIFQRKKLSTLRLHSHLIQNHLRRIEGLPVSILPIPAEVLEEFGATWEDIETIANQILALEDTLLSVVLKEYPEATRLSLRSVGDFPCHELAQRFDVGGGHKNAAGATLYKSLEDAVTFTENLLRYEYADSLLSHYRTFMANLELQELAQ